MKKFIRITIGVLVLIPILVFAFFVFGEGIFFISN